MKEILLTILRNKATKRHEFQEAATKLGFILAQETSQLLATKAFPLETPLAATTGIKPKNDIALIIILRSGIALLQPFLTFFPHASVGVTGIKRDEKTAEAHLYYNNLPPIHTNHQVIILDPMLATGGTALELLTLLKEQSIKEEQIIFVNILCAAEGLQKVKYAFPAINFVHAAVDPTLNAQKFIIPGFGDFGDRYFGTE